MKHRPICRPGTYRTAALIVLSGVLCFGCTTGGGDGGDPPDDVLRTFAEGKRLYQAGNIAEAREIFRTIRRSHPRFIQNIYMEGKCAYLLEAYGEAVEILTPSTSAESSIDGAKWLARSYLALDRSEYALAVLEAAMRRSSEDAELLLLSAKAYRQEGRTEAALAAYHRAEALSERFAEIHLGLAEMYRGAGFDSRAAGHLERSLAFLGEGSGLREPVETLLRGLREEARE